MKPEKQAQMLARQLAFAAAARELDVAEKKNAPPELIKKLREVYDQRESEYEATIAAVAEEPELMA